MEAVTAIKIHIVYDKPFTGSNPLAARARKRKNPIKKGPDFEIFPPKIKARTKTRHTNARINAIL
jgi:hypothetical protein